MKTFCCRGCPIECPKEECETLGYLQAHADAERRAASLLQSLPKMEMAG